MVKELIIYRDNKYTVYFDHDDCIHVKRYGVIPPFQEFNANVVDRLARVIRDKLGTVDNSTSTEVDNVVAINLNKGK